MKIKEKSNLDKSTKKTLAKTLKAVKTKHGLLAPAVKNFKIEKSLKTPIALKKKLKTRSKPVIHKVDSDIEIGVGRGLNISSETINQAVSVILELHRKRADASKVLLLRDDSSVFLQINLLKVPEIDQPRRKFLKLHHSPWGEDAEVCLFVRNSKNKDKARRTPDEKIEFSVDRYQQLLARQGVEGITGIIPVSQLQTEYNSYELKRKLVDRFDVFVCQSTLLERGQFMRQIGVAFTKKNKLPVVVKFPEHLEKPDPKFKQRMSDALRTTWFHLRPQANSYSVKIGNLSHTKEQLRENMLRVLGQLGDEDTVPGGAANIKSLLLKTNRSPCVPLYMNLASRNSVPTPKIRSHLPKDRSETDEISTQPGKKVTVSSSGDVFITDDENFKPPPNWSDDDDDEGESEVAAKTPDIQKKKQKRKQQGADESNDDDDNSSSEDELKQSAVEEDYINQWEIEQQSNDEDNDDDIPPPVRERKSDKKKAQRLKKNALQKASVKQPLKVSKRKGQSEDEAPVKASSKSGTKNLKKNVNVVEDKKPMQQKRKKPKNK